MTASVIPINTVDTGILCLVALCRFHQLPVDAAQLTREFGDVLDCTTIQRAAKTLGLRCKLVTPAGKIDNAILPAIAKQRDGSYFVLARQQDEKILIHDLREPQPRVVSSEEFNALWSGELLLFTRRRNISESLQQQFDISWFIPALFIYKKLLTS